MTVGELWIYPVKSLRGIAVETAYLEERGLRDDRRMMLVHTDGRFISQREHAGLALIDVASSREGWTISSAGHGEVSIDRQAELEALEVTVWKNTLTARRVSHAADNWLSKVAGFPVQLVRMSAESHRPLNPDFAREGEEVSFADGFPVLVISRSSLDNLNSKLDAPIEMRRFRPNLVIHGASPHEEDGWPEIQIGEARLRSTKRCGRCVVTTIDPETGIAGQEPLRTLAAYRKNGQSVDFGMNYATVANSEIRIGDTVEISGNS